MPTSRPQPAGWARARLVFRPGYFGTALTLLALEVVIAVAVHDRLIRPYAGDALATVLLYCLVRSFIRVPVQRAVVVALLGSYFIESLQFIGLLSLLELQQSRVAGLLLGSHFEWTDLLAYTLGAGLVWVVEKRWA